jgi:creatinine amidohydrolase/Fe(II)-dependent formamide hydrolase-like protein
MRYEMMLPHQIRAAIDARWPVVLPLGVLEYHGEHMSVGMDTLAVTGVLDILEKEMNLVILPPFYYGAASYAVEPPERNGTLHVDAEALVPFAKAMFQGLLRIGFRNIHVFVHHQTENFLAGMPTDLAFKFAARQAIFAFLEKERGEGWWGIEKMADYYAQQSASQPSGNFVARRRRAEGQPCGACFRNAVENCDRRQHSSFLKYPRKPLFVGGSSAECHDPFAGTTRSGCLPAFR